MFTESDTIVVLAKKQSKIKLFKLKMDATAKERFIRIVNTGVNGLCYDFLGSEVPTVPFETNYNIQEGDNENFIIADFSLPLEICDVVDRLDTLEVFHPINSDGLTQDKYRITAILVVTVNTDGQLLIAGQRFTKKQIFQPRRISMFFNGDTFKEESDTFRISLSETVDCLYCSAGLIFKRYADANAVFDISEYYRVASAAEITRFKEYGCIEICDESLFGQRTRSVPVRRKIARILDLGEQINMQKIKQGANAVKLNLEYTSDGKKIIMPGDGKSFRKVLSFLSEEMYPGIFTNDTYLSNSTRKIS